MAAPVSFLKNVKWLWLQAGLIVLLGLWIFSPAFFGGWLWDDNIAITDNALIHSRWGLWYIWFHSTNVDYFPLKDTVEWFQWRLWRMETLGYHLTNVALHLASAFLIWRLFARLGMRLAWLGGLLFVVHPLVVESVAWISELKNTLSLPLLLLAMIAWIDYDERRTARPYLLALLFFIAAMLAKTSVVMFPLVILLHGWWRHGHIRRQEFLASLPFFAVSFALGLVTIWFQHTRTMDAAAVAGEPFLHRFAGAGVSMGFYLFKTVVPVGLQPVYPHWEIGQLLPLGFILLFLFALVFAWLMRKGAPWKRHAALGLGFFLLNLFPVLGFISMTWTHLSQVADHFIYLPLIGLIGLVVAGISQSYEQSPQLRSYLISLFTLVTLGLASESHDYAKIFRDSRTFSAYIIAHNPANWNAYNNLGLELMKQGDNEEAIRQFQSVLRIDPRNAMAHDNWGTALERMGHPQEAIAQFEEALRLDPKDATAHLHWGEVLSFNGQLEGAVRQYEEALRVNPDSAQAHCNLGVTLVQLNRVPEAVKHYLEAIAINPDHVAAHHNLGRALEILGHLPQAIAQFEKTVDLTPDDPEARNDLGATLVQAGHLPEGIAQYREALRLDPKYAQARGNLGIALGQMKQLPEAIAQFQEAIRLQPHDAGMRYNLAVALLQSGQNPAAAAQLREAVRLKPDYDDAQRLLARLRSMGF